MTGVADKRREVFDELRVAASVGIVAADTVVLGQFVDKLEFFQFTLGYDVA